MNRLVERIRREGAYLGNGIVKVDGFLNHQIDPDLAEEMGTAFARRFREAGVTGVTRVVTAEVSGIIPAYATARAMGVPMVYARKKRPVTMGEGVFEAEAPSHTYGGTVHLYLSREYLSPRDRVLLIDDFLARGLTIAALIRLIQQSGATLCGVGCVIEKAFENGREYLSAVQVPILSLATVDLVDGSLVITGARDAEEQ